MGRTFGTLAVAFMALGAGCYIGNKFKKPDRVEEVGFITKDSDSGIYGLRLRMFSEKEYFINLEKPLYMAPGQETSSLESSVVEGYSRRVRTDVISNKEASK